MRIYDIHKFRLAVEGQVLDYNGDLGYDYDQCVDVPNLWARWVGQAESYNNAIDLSYAGWCEWVNNEPTNHPPPGAILIWNGPPADTVFGHTAVALRKCNEWKIRALSQNWPEGAPCTVVDFTYEGVAGWWKPTAIRVR